MCDLSIFMSFPSSLLRTRYFNDDEDEDASAAKGPYQAAPGSPGAASDDSDDPLDAFMQGIEVKRL